MDKFRKVLEFIDNPGEYSPEEINSILADPEMRGLYDTLCSVSGSLHASDLEIDNDSIDREWQDFNNRHRQSAWRILWRQRRAAITTAVVATSLVAVGMGIGLTLHHQQPARSDSAMPPVASVNQAMTAVNTDSVADASPTVAEIPASIKFEDETLESIMTQIASRYGLEVRFLSDSPKSLRLYFVWDTSQTAEETIASLDNFERFSITLEDPTIIIK